MAVQSQKNGSEQCSSERSVYAVSSGLNAMAKIGNPDAIGMRPQDLHPRLPPPHISIPSRQYIPNQTLRELDGFMGFE